MAAHDREAAWRAIAEFFPPDKSAENLRYARLAMKGLGEYYFSNEQWADALFEEGHDHLARGTPGGPKVNDHHLAFEIR